MEPDWLAVRAVRLARSTPRCRLVHFTDLHHKGDNALLDRVVNQINKLSPEFVCFTGDIVEEAEHLPSALERFSRIKAPLYGVPGNHDYWAQVDFGAISTVFAATGGAWLTDTTAIAPGGKVRLHGATCTRQPAFAPEAGMINLLLIHYPAWSKHFTGQRYDLALAGHSHGGQVRLPFFGPLVVPWGVDEFDLGLFESPTGPLYVGAGIGWFYINVRFRCRPEITLIEL